jgi:protein TIF31
VYLSLSISIKRALQLGETHDKTQESSDCLKHLTQQAVVLQKKMNDIYTNGKLISGLPPIHIQPPSMGSVLDMLNAINGIIFVQISQKDIANLKNEIEKRQKESNGDDSTEVIKGVEGEAINGTATNTPLPLKS